jgi:hypothetical protein
MSGARVAPRGHATWTRRVGSGRRARPGSPTPHRLNIVRPAPGRSSDMTGDIDMSGPHIDPLTDLAPDVTRMLEQVLARRDAAEFVGADGLPRTARSLGSATRTIRSRLRAEACCIGWTSCGQPPAPRRRGGRCGCRARGLRPCRVAHRVAVGRPRRVGRRVCDGLRRGSQRRRADRRSPPGLPAPCRLR